MEAVNNRLEGRWSGTLGGNISIFQVKVSHLRVWFPFSLVHVKW